MNVTGIESFMAKKVAATRLLEDYSGELHAGKLARVPLENSICANGGSTFAYLRRGTSNHLIVMLMGGGLSWNAETAKYPQTPEAILNSKGPALYAIKADTFSEFAIFGLSKKPGVFTPGSENLFAGWNVMIVNYVTGDFHVGANDFPYTSADGSENILHHRGHSNFIQAMNACKSFFPSADKLLITGGSAGAFAVPALAPEIMDFYPGCTDVTVYSDSALLLMDSFGDTAKNIWKANPELTQAIHSNNISADWYERLYQLKGNSIRYLYSNSCRDYMFAIFQNYIDNGKYAGSKENCKAVTPRLKQHIGHLRQVCPGMAFNVNDFRAAAPGAKGTEHCTITNHLFFKKHRSGVSDMQWLYDAVNGKMYDAGLDLLEK